MNLPAIVTRLRRRVGSPTTAEVPDSEMEENINDAYRDVAHKFRHHKSRKLCSFSTVATQSKYGLPADVGAIYRVWDDTNKIRLRKRGVRWFSMLPTQTDDQPLD